MAKCSKCGFVITTEMLHGHEKMCGGKVETPPPSLPAEYVRLLQRYEDCCYGQYGTSSVKVVARSKLDAYVQKQQADLAACRAELAEAKAFITKWSAEKMRFVAHEQLRKDLSAALASQERLRGALRKYGFHIDDCPHNLFQPDCDLEQACTCGFAAALASEGGENE